jgi:hypothetical protein
MKLRAAGCSERAQKNRRLLSDDFIRLLDD